MLGLINYKIALVAGALLAAVAATPSPAYAGHGCGGYYSSYYYSPAPVVVYSSPVYYAPPPVVVSRPVYYYDAAPGYYRPARSYGFSFGYSRGYRPSHHRSTSFHGGFSYRRYR